MARQTDKEKVMEILLGIKKINPWFSLKRFLEVLSTVNEGDPVIFNSFGI
jgi:hypothetical protein